MELLYGLKSGMVMQRDGAGLCDITFSVICEGTPRFELDGRDELKATANLTELEKRDSGEKIFSLKGIPSGGPYNAALVCDDGSIQITGFYVGDVWILAGQSNMEGAGTYRDVAGRFDDYSDVRFYSFDSTWQRGNPRCNPTFRSGEEYLKRALGAGNGVALPERVEDRGVGPGHFFACEMYRRTGVPQGLIPCALGGSGMFQWNADEYDPEVPNLYHIMLKRYRECGSNARGMFWYQGCSEANPGGVDKFTDNMIKFVSDFRRDFDKPDMPIVQVQINSFTWVMGEGDVWWNSIREQQRTLGEKISNLDTVATTTAELVDCIHMHSRYHAKLGVWAAESMYRLCFDPQGMVSTPAPQLDRIYDVNTAPDFGNTLAVKYKNLNGRLISEGRPTGYSFSTVPDRIDTGRIIRTDLHNDTAYIRYEIPREVFTGGYLSYFFGNQAYANITDSDGRPLPAFGPLKISDILNK